MSIQLYGTMLSPPVRSVVMFCKLNNISFTFKYIDLSKGDQKSEEFKKINPFGRSLA